jgi:hypothetical protein
MDTMNSTRSDLSSTMDSELLHNCIEEFDRIIFHVPQEFTLMDDQLNHFIEGTIIESSASDK